MSCEYIEIIFEETKKKLEIPDYSNWLILDKVLMGSYPDPKDNKHKKLIELGVKIFVCLQEDNELETFRSYKEDINDNIEFIQFPIKDRSIADDDKTLNFVKVLIEKIKNLKEGELMYIHCFGGKGRTGLISSLVYSFMYKKDGKTTLEYIQNVYNKRKDKGKCRNKKCPQTSIQFKQVYRLSYKK